MAGEVCAGSCLGHTEGMLGAGNCAVEAVAGSALTGSNAAASRPAHGQGCCQHWLLSLIEQACQAALQCWYRLAWATKLLCSGLLLHSSDRWRVIRAPTPVHPAAGTGEPPGARLESEDRAAVPVDTCDWASEHCGSCRSSSWLHTQPRDLCSWSTSRYGQRASVRDSLSCLRWQRMPTVYWRDSSSCW